MRSVPVRNFFVGGGEKKFMIAREREIENFAAIKHKKKKKKKEGIASVFSSYK